MKQNALLRFFKPRILTVIICIVISYFIVPVFSVPSPCYNLANSSADPTVWSVPCIKLTTVQEHLHPTYTTRFGFHYQNNAGYYYDLSTKYYVSASGLFFAYIVGCGIMFCAYWVIRYVKKSFIQ
jgi:multidrug efflux pump subunit AcrB